MLYFTTTRIIFFLFGVAFLGFTLVFGLSRSSRRAHLANCVLFLADFGSFFVIIGLWDNLERVRLLAHFLSLAAGLGLVPIGLALLVKLLGNDRRRGMIAGLAFLALLIYALTNGMFVYGLHDSWPLTICYGFMFVSYSITIAVEAYRLRPLRSLPRHLALFLAVMCGATLLSGLMAVFEALWFVPGQHAMWLLIAILICTCAGIVYRHPEAFSLIEEESKAVRQGRSLLGGIDVDSKLGELDRAMREAQLFRDSELSLEQLAERAGLNPHQLSELLNSSAKKTFPEYVTQYRVEQAMRDLAEPGGKTILDIAFSCGFNAKSTFNEAFRKATGLTPSAYREAERARVQTE
jgi:AraC-like DNA-binding protein